MQNLQKVTYVKLTAPHCVLRGQPANGFPAAATAGVQQGAGPGHNQLSPEDEPVTDSEDDLDSLDDMDCEDGYEDDCEHECEDEDMAGDYSYDHTRAQEVGTCNSGIAAFGL